MKKLSHKKTLAIRISKILFFLISSTKLALGQDYYMDYSILEELDLIRYAIIPNNDFKAIDEIKFILNDNKNKDFIYEAYPMSFHYYDSINGFEKDSFSVNLIKKTNFFLPNKYILNKLKKNGYKIIKKKKELNWDTFKKKNPNLQGIVNISMMRKDETGKYCIFYLSKVYGELSGEGMILIYDLEKSEIFRKIHLWVS